MDKKTESITFKCSDEVKQKALLIGRAKKFPTVSEYIHDLLIKDISETEDYLKTLMPVMSLTTDTVDTTFELTSPLRLIDVTPKRQTQKKLNCCDQLSLIAVHSEK